MLYQNKVPQLCPPPSALLACGDKLILNLPVWRNCLQKHVLCGTAVLTHASYSHLLLCCSYCSPDE